MVGLVAEPLQEGIGFRPHHLPHLRADAHRTGSERSLPVTGSGREISLTLGIGSDRERRGGVGVLTALPIDQLRHRGLDNDSAPSHGRTSHSGRVPTPGRIGSRLLKIWLELMNFSQHPRHGVRTRARTFHAFLLDVVQGLRLDRRVIMTTMASTYWLK